MSNERVILEHLNLACTGLTLLPILYRRDDGDMCAIPRNTEILVSCPNITRGSDISERDISEAMGLMEEGEHWGDFGLPSRPNLTKRIRPMVDAMRLVMLRLADDDIDGAKDKAGYVHTLMTEWEESCKLPWNREDGTSDE